MKERTDEELMLNVAKGDIDTLSILFEKHHKHVFNFLCRMCGDRILSEDITQEVFYKILKYRQSYNGGKFVTWLFTIARNSLAAHNSRSREYLCSFQGIEFMQEEVEAGINSENHDQLFRALNQLKPADKELLVLTKLQKMRYKDVAQITGSTPGAVKTKVNRAFNKLRKLYFKEEQHEE